MLALSVFDLDPTMSPSGWTAHWKELQERGSLSFETTHKTKDGELFPIEVTANYVEQDGSQYNFAFARDISERRRLERSLRLTQFSLDHSTDYIFWIDREGRLLYLSEGTCRRLGYEPSEALGLTVFDVDPQAPQPWAEHWAQLKAHGSLTFETVHMTKAGEVFPVEVTASYVEFDGQELTAAWRATSASAKWRRRSCVKPRRRPSGLTRSCWRLSASSSCRRAPML